MKGVAFSINNYPLKNSAILDSGTTLHIFNQISRFLNFRTALEGEFVWAGDHKIPILGYGEVDIKVKHQIGGTRIMRLYNVALCEGIVCNLVSLRILRQKGYYWDTKPKTTLIRRSDNSVLCSLKEKHNQFVLEDILEDIDQAAFFARRNNFNSWTKRRPKAGDALLWHLRLGHPGPQALEHLVNSSQGVRIKGITTVECDACGTCKAKRQIRRFPRKIGEGPGKRIAIDFHDFEEDEDNYNSLMLITDRWSGYMWDFYLQDRTADSIITVLSTFLGLLKNQYELKPQVFECDNELTSQKPRVKIYIESLHIRIEPSPPYTQALNGGAERSGGVVKQKINSMRMGSKLPTALWKEISKTAVYLLNRTPRYQYYWKTPYDQFYTFIAQRNSLPINHKRPDQSHLRAYGCKAFAMTTDALKKANRLQRFNPKAWIGYLVGYDSTNVYRVWNPVTNKVVRTRDVTFNENETFNGDLETLKDDMLKIQLDELSKLLQECTIPEELEEMLVQPAQEELDEIRTLAEDEIPVYTTCGTDQGQKKMPYPTPPPSPPASMLAASIRGIQDTEISKKEMSKISRTESWKATFLAGSRSGMAGKVNDKVVSKAQLERLLRKPLALHRRDLPPPPTKHSDLEKHPIGYLFEQAELVHLDSHKIMKSWLEISSRDPKVKGHRVLDCKWVYVYKFDKHSRFLKAKARLVVRGDQQAKSLTENTYAATLAGRSFRTLIAIAARFDLELIQYDAVNAFVHAELEEDMLVFMKMPPGHRRTGTILKLNKALYGLRKSPLLWQKELTRTIRKLGFEPVPHEPCCFMKNGIIMFFYVDDIVFAYKKHQKETVSGLVNQLQLKYTLTGGEDLQWFLGIEILRDREEKLIWLSQSSYIDKIANLAETAQSSSTRTPMSKEELLPNEDIVSYQEITKYQRKIGSLLYTAVITRPDIAFAVSRLSRFITNPGPKHHEGADRVLNYLKDTRSLALQYGGDDHFRVASDASFADNSIDRKSSQAYAMKLFGGVIGWRASKQETVTTSTTEAELLALSQAAKEALFVSRLIKELRIKLDDNHIRIECDNTQTIRLVTEEIAVLQTKLRHVDIHNHWLRQEVQNGMIRVEYTESARMMADGLTKALQNNDFSRFVEHMNLKDVHHLLAQKREIDLQELELEKLGPENESDPE